MFVDTHCHLGHIEEAADEVLAAARDARVNVVVDIGMGTAESRAAADRAARYNGVYASVGIHPNDLDEFDAGPEATLSSLRDLARNPRVVGIGETGLDFYRVASARGLQEDSFRAHIALASELDLALIVHCRDAHARVLEVLDDAGAPDRVVMHCFSGDVGFARECAARGFFCSFAGNLTFRNADPLRAAAREVPRELLLIETDAPFLAPAPFRGKPNAPRLLPYTAEALATVRAEPVADIAIALRDNSARAFAVEFS